MAGKNTNPKRPAQPRKPGGSDSLLGWLGRQIGHVKKAVSTDVTKRPPKKVAQPAPVKKPAAGPPSTVVFRQDKVEEVDMPDRPGVKLRRTTIDEVIVEKKGP